MTSHIWLPVNLRKAISRGIPYVEDLPQLWRIKVPDLDPDPDQIDSKRKQRRDKTQDVKLDSQPSLIISYRWMVRWFVKNAII